MRTREACVEASIAAEQACLGTTEQLSEAFDRWELTLAENEGWVEPPEDALQNTFESEEELAELRQELEQLRDEGSP